MNMSFVMRWDREDILKQLRSCTAQACSSYNDGFTQWGCKQDLLVIQHELNKMLSDCPNFAPEQAFKTQLEQDLMWKALSK